MIRIVYPSYASQTEANRQYSETINNIIEALNYSGVNNVTDTQEVSTQFGFYFAVN